MERHIVSWVQETTDRGVRACGSRLRQDDHATTVRIDGDELMICDGPFAETKEPMAGFEVLECARRVDPMYLVSSGRLVGVSAGPMTSNGIMEVRP
jgi:hypothetical protein